MERESIPGYGIAGAGGEGMAGKRRERALETAIFLFLIVPSMILSFFAVRQGNLSFTLTAISVVARDLALVSLIIFFLLRNGEPVASIGWVSKKTTQDALLGSCCMSLCSFW